jgi:hypothetical protein
MEKHESASSSFSTEALFAATDHSDIPNGVEQTPQLFTVNIGGIKLCTPGSGENPPPPALKIAASRIIVPQDSILSARGTMLASTGTLCPRTQSRSLAEPHANWSAYAPLAGFGSHGANALIVVAKSLIVASESER